MAADTPPQHHLVEMVRVRRAIEIALNEIGADKLTSALGEPEDDREAIASTFSFAINGLSFEGRFVLLRGTH